MKPLLIILLGCLVAACSAQLNPKYNDPLHGMEPGKMPRWAEMDTDMEFTNDPEFMQQYLKDMRIPLPPSYEKFIPFFKIFPGPKYEPGDVMEGTDHDKINHALTDILKAGDLTEGVRAAIGHANVEGKTQFNPHWYLYSGVVHSNLAPIVEEGYTSLMLFTKTPWAVAGTVGVYSHDVVDTDYKVCVMWSVPYSDLLYDWWFNIKLYPQSFGTNKDMYEQMYYDAGSWRGDGYYSRSEFGVGFLGTMTENDKSEVIIWSNTTGFDPNGEPHLHRQCSYHPGQLGDRCNQECYPQGWCWLDVKCDNDAECQDLGTYPCDSGC